MHSRRALLYVPGDDRHKIEKSLTLNVDCICLDMEDGVAPARKMEARLCILSALHELDFGSAEKLVRINPVGSGFEADELAVILPATRMASSSRRLRIPGRWPGSAGRSNLLNWRTAGLSIPSA